MKKIILVLLTVLIYFNAAAQTTELHKKFIKGSISDKTAAVKEASGDEALKLAAIAVDFVIENTNITGPDRDMSALAVASVLKLPKNNDSLIKCLPHASTKLTTLFKSIDDDNVRIAVLDKLEVLGADSPEALELMNSYLKNQALNAPASSVTEKVIAALGKTGNSNSFIIMYSAWKNKSFPVYKATVEKSLLQLSVNNLSDVVKIISSSNTGDIRDYFNLVKNSSDISSNFKAEVAENALSMAIHNVDGIDEDKTENIELQLNCIQSIAEANWTRAAGISVRFFSLAKQEYEKELLTEAQFIDVINHITRLSSSDCAQMLSKYLAEMNVNAENNVLPAQNVILTVIKSLGVLGDKSAFDNLLYVTYLNYSAEVKGAARDSLAKLKW